MTVAANAKAIENIERRLDDLAGHDKDSTVSIGVLAESVAAINGKLNVLMVLFTTAFIPMALGVTWALFQSA